MIIIRAIDYRKIITILILFGLLVNLQAIGQDKMVKAKVGESISIDIPAAFVVMSDEDIITKFVSSKKPLAAYTNENRTIEFSVNESNTSWTEKDLVMMKSFYKSSIQSLYDEIHYINEAIVDINKRKFVVFEFNSKIKSEDDAIVKQSDIIKYTYIQYTLIDGKTILFHFTCPKREQQSWQKSIQQLMASVKIKQ